MVNQKIPDGELFRYIGIVHDEFWNVVLDLIVPFQFPLAHQYAKRRSGKTLCDGSYSEQRACIYLTRGSDGANAIAIGIDNSSAFNDCNGQTRHVEGLHGTGRQLINLLSIHWLRVQGYARGQENSCDAQRARWFGHWIHRIEISLESVACRRPVCCDDTPRRVC